ncbi:MAG: acyltransferase [Burkholderiales bacterium]|nr:acyltransferase [Burkholderiales bacterium]MBL0242720.1 acyltransferase [Rhodoferax sp.]
MQWPIELLRGIAALMVVFAHYWGLAGVKAGLFVYFITGVDLFFVISGYVFAPYFFGKTLHPQSFFIKRFFRIYPLYACSLLIYVFLKFSTSQEAKYLVTHLFLLYTTESREIAFYYNQAYWSLPVEIEFYLFLPALAYIARLKGGLFVMVALALVLHCVIAFFSPTDMRMANNFLAFSVHLPGLLIEFLLGVIAWQISRNELTARARFLMIFAGAALWVIAAWVFSFYFARGGDNAVMENDVLRGNIGLFAALAFMPIVAALGRFGQRAPPWLRIVSVWLGNLSFGIYLFHNAAPQILNLCGVIAPPVVFAALCIILTFLIAQVLYVWVENPSRNYGRAVAS